MQTLIKLLKIVGVVAAVASAAAAWFAACSVYRESHSPFSPAVSFGTPAFGLSAGTVSVGLPLSISNSGAQSGCIGDVALRLQSKATNTRWAFFPAFFLDITSYLRAMPGKAEAFSAIESPATPIKLSGHEKMVKGILFMPRPAESPAVPSLKVEDLTPNDMYTFEVFIIWTGSDCVVTPQSKYIPAAKAEFLLASQLLQDLRQNRVVFPLDKVRNSLREDFLQTH